jgi:hypothetical protein
MNATRGLLEHAVGPDGLVVIRSASGDVRVRGIPGDTVRVRADGPTELAGLVMARGEHSLEIGRAPGADANGTHTSGESTDLEIDIPAAASVVIDVASADIEVRGMIGDQRYRSSSGDLLIDEVAGQVTAEAMSGDIEVRADGPGAFDLRTVSGDLRLRAGSIAMLRATTTSGDVHIDGTFDGDGPYVVQSVSGDIDLDPSGDALVEVRTITGTLHNTVAATRHAESGLRTIQVGGGGTVVDVRSTSGDVTVSAPMVDREPAKAHIAPVPAAEPALNDSAQLDILRAVERGDLDLDEASQRLDALEGADPEDLTRVR